MLNNLKRLLACAGAVFAPRIRATNFICFLLSVSAFMALAESARAQSGYCIQAVGQDDRGIRIRIDGLGNGCSLFEAVRQYQHAGKDGATLLRQEQMRSIWAANLVVRADGTYSQTVVKRSCSKEAVPKYEPGTSGEEIAACSGKRQAFYYALPNSAFLIPQERASTLVEKAEQKKAEEAAQLLRDREAAEAAALAREESEAFKRLHEMEKRVIAAETKVTAAEQRLAWVADKEWRAKSLPLASGLLVLAAAWAILATLGVSALRFKYRALAVDGYGYSDPLAATEDLLLKLSAAREENKSARQMAEAERAKSASRIQELEANIESQRLELGNKLTLNASLRNENEGLKRTVETLRAPLVAATSEAVPAAEVLRDRCASLDQQYNDLDEEHKKLQGKYAALKTAFEELDEAHRTIYQVRDRQARMLMEVNEEKTGLQGRIETLTSENAELRKEYGRAQAAIAEYETNWSTVLRASNRPPPVVVPYPAATSEGLPPPARGQTLPAAAAPEAAMAEYPTVTSAEAEPEEVFAGLFQELADAKRVRDVYRDGMRQIESLQSWLPAPESDDVARIEERVRRIVTEVSRTYRFGSDGLHARESEAPASGPLPTATQSDIVRIARVANLLNGQPLDVAVLRGILTESESLLVVACLKACVHEWSVRADREPMIYSVFEPCELHDLNRLLCSQLSCGPEISLMVPEGFAEAVDRVHLAYAPAFSRRAVMRSLPPPAMPQASG